MIIETMKQANQLLELHLISQSTFDKIMLGLALQSQDKLISN